ncbi:gluconokinase [Kushneria phosphatilytica]|uniref:Gluconokinase n=1 Tax=Kushneria phosphatilytica TaxID=657387 RepID=A0A1S1NUG4_9GAMM|nr:gluconokinase [Kushneria phosphatilytica]OHV13828.1 gluconate kinase [Kushneria phosphatilytica]QEL10383.1 gluconokinase [Kushneria phosphatilytica]
MANGTEGYRLKRSRRIVVMGVSGSGKSTIGDAIGERMGIPYIDGDQYHPQNNIEKMSRGEPLNDEDRAGWLERLAELIDDYRERDETVLVGCSSLKHSYRDILRRGDENLIFLFLDGSYNVILGRMQERKHFFSADMLTTQFDTLERPGEEEAMRVDIDVDFHDVVEAGVRAIVDRDDALTDQGR